MLADEPTGNLDRDTGEQVLSELITATDDNITVVAVTHDEYVAEFSDRTLRLVDGRILRDQSDLSPGTVPTEDPQPDPEAATSQPPASSTPDDNRSHSADPGHSRGANGADPEADTEHTGGESE